MTTDDPSGYLPPHELRGLLGTLIDHPQDRGSVPPGPSGSPGLATAAIVPPPTAPAIPFDDPNGMALVISQIAGELFGGASVVAMQPASLATAASSSPASPGLSPQLAPAPMPTDPVRPQLVPAVPSSPPTGDIAVHSLETSVVAPFGGSSSAWGLEPFVQPNVSRGDRPPSRSVQPSASQGDRPGDGLSPPPGVSGASRSVQPSASQGDRSGDGLSPPPEFEMTTMPDRDPAWAPPSDYELGRAPPEFGYSTADIAGIPLLDQIGSAAPPLGGVGAGLAPPGPPTAAAIPASYESVPTSDRGWATASPVAPRTASPHEISPPLASLEWVPLVGDVEPSSAIAMPEPLRLPVVASEPDAAAFATAEPYWMTAQPTRPDRAEPNARISGSDRRAEPAPVVSDRDGAFDPYAARRDFPILEERVHAGKRLVWLDNAATTQKPRAVIDRLTYFYEHENSNVHRAAHTLAARATDAFESARETTRKFLNAPSAGEIVFVRGATEGINLIAKAWGRRNVERGDEIVVTHLEHHANIVPWQQLCAETGARLRVAPVDDRGDVILEQYEKLFCSRTKLASFTQVSNALGTITPAREMIAIAHRYGATVVLDGAQAVSHMQVDVQQLDCDFYVFSGHKVFAPTGIGAVFGKRAILEGMPPWQGGGNMIQDVTFERTTYQPPPGRFEAGTGNIADAAGMGAALDYVMRIGMTTIDRYEHELMVYATECLHRVPGLRMIGTSPNKAGVLSFVLDGQRTEDVGAALDKDGIAVRSGHHCAQPILRRFGVESSVRASLAFYNVREDIDALIDALNHLQSHRATM